MEKNKFRDSNGRFFKGCKSLWVGKHHSKETKIKIGNVTRGNTVWRGRKHKKKSKLKISASLMGHIGLQGEENPTWKGNKIEKGGIHQWLHKHFGKADRCENRQNHILNFKCSSKSKNYDWANIKKHIYKRKREDYVMLCRSCHKKYDRNQKSKAC